MEGTFKKLEANVNKLSKEFVKCNSEWKYLKETLESEQKRLKSTQKSKAEVRTCWDLC